VHLVGVIIRIYHDARAPEFYPKTKFDKLMHLVGFMITIYHEFYSKNKFEKSVHLVGVIIRIYHDARASEFYPKTKFEKSVHLVGFIIRITTVMYNT
jgi:uncharacterized protein YqiB (DUF1249 family)